VIANMQFFIELKLFIWWKK